MVAFRTFLAKQNLAVDCLRLLGVEEWYLGKQRSYVFVFIRKSMEKLTCLCSLVVMSTIADTNC